jgi:hypothetical protein
MEERIRYRQWVASSPQGDFVAAGEFVFFGFTFLLILDPSAKVDAKTAAGVNDHQETYFSEHQADSLRSLSLR